MVNYLMVVTIMMMMMILNKAEVDDVKTTALMYTVIDVES